MLLTALFVLAAPPANPNPEWDPAWPEAETSLLSEHRQLTSRDDFYKAGEAYFSSDSDRIIFQAVPAPAAGQAPDRHYTMYVADLRDDGTPLRMITPLSEPGSANTCGWFHPDDPALVLFGTTTTPPREANAPGYQRGTSRYVWQFPRETEIVATRIVDTSRSRRPQRVGALFERDGYDAEASWSPDGRHVLYTHVAPESNDGDLWVYDSRTGHHTELVAQPGYDGGPFFSPDARRIVYRSDRRGDKALQVFVATLVYDDDGAIVGVKDETAITDDEHVNWCPFFTPDGKYLLYASSRLGHGNYEIFAVDASGKRAPDQTVKLRVTHARGFDGLPVVSPDGRWMMWTAQRGPLAEGETRPSSQLWIARFDPDALDRAYRKAQERADLDRAAASVEDFPAP